MAAVEAGHRTSGSRAFGQAGNTLPALEEGYCTMDISATLGCLDRPRHSVRSHSSDTVLECLQHTTWAK